MDTLLDQKETPSALDPEALLDILSLREKVEMLSGSGFYKIHAETKQWGARPYPGGAANARLGMAGLQFSDGPRGVTVGASTCFPCSMARGATFDRDLEHRIGEAMGVEARAQGVNLLANVCINLLRHPAWGRAQETYGEDTYHLGEMGAALTRGTQRHNVIATVKHFALNSMENNRFNVDVHVEERTLREVYLPHFRRVIEAGCLSVMTAYNKVNGDYCAHNRHLLTTILRDEWSFEGFVHSDWVLGLYGPDAITAGLDIENPEPVWFGEMLLEAIQAGDIDSQYVDRALGRVLSVLDKVARAADPHPDYSADLVASRPHVQLALEAAEKSAVLLQNRQLLPLARSEVRKIGVFGRLATLANTGDNGSSRVNAPHVVTPLEGLVDYLGTDRVILAGDERDPTAAGRAARDCDTAVVVVGYTAEEEGEYIPGDINLGQDNFPERLSSILSEAQQRSSGRDIGGDRRSLSLPDEQIALIRSLASNNARTLVVLVSGSAVMVEEWIQEVPAVLQTFYAGMQGGTALARLLFGETCPSGRLPFTVARDAADYPFFDPDAAQIDYDYWHGYPLFERENLHPRFPFGYGLSYTGFRYSKLLVVRGERGLDVEVIVTNTGNRKGIDTPQLYIGWPGLAAQRPRKSLRGFERIELAPGESRRIHFHIALEDLAWFDPSNECWKIERGPHCVSVGRSSADAEAVRETVEFEREIKAG